MGTDISGKKYTNFSEINKAYSLQKVKRTLECKFLSIYNTHEVTEGMCSCFTDLEVKTERSKASIITFEKSCPKTKQKNNNNSINRV